MWVIIRAVVLLPLVPLTLITLSRRSSSVTQSGARPPASRTLRDRARQQPLAEVVGKAQRDARDHLRFV